MDKDFRLDSQISAVVKSSFFQLVKVKIILSKVHFKTAILAFITTRPDYWNSLYADVSQASLSRPQLVQNVAARLWTATRKGEHITPVLSSLHWLLLHFGVLLFVFKSLNGLAPPYLSELLSRSLRSADQLMSDVPRTQQRLRGDGASAVATPKLWNLLLLHIRKASSLDIFKSELSTHLFRLAFDPVCDVDFILILLF